MESGLSVLKDKLLNFRFSRTHQTCGWVQENMLDFKFSGTHLTCIVGVEVGLGLGLGFMLYKLLNFRFSGTQPNLWLGLR